MMNVQPGRREPIEKIFLNTPPRGWVALSIGGCGIIVQTQMGRHLKEYRETQKIAMRFAHRVIEAVGFSPEQALSTPQILVETADAVIEDPEKVFLHGTIWRYLLEEVEVCSVGSNEVLVFEQEGVRKALTSHSISESEMVQRQGLVVPPIHRRQ